MKKILLAAVSAVMASVSMSFAQTTIDGLMMPKGAFCTGFIYGQDKWTQYWEGDRKRENPNVGTVSMRSLVWMGNYGISNKVNIIAMVPYVWTKATGGTLRSMEGLQDL